MIIRGLGQPEGDHAPWNLTWNLKTGKYLHTHPGGGRVEGVLQYVRDKDTIAIDEIQRADHDALVWLNVHNESTVSGHSYSRVALGRLKITGAIER